MPICKIYKNLLKPCVISLSVCTCVSNYKYKITVYIFHSLMRNNVKYFSEFINLLRVAELIIFGVEIVLYPAKLRKIYVKKENM